MPKEVNVAELVADLDKVDQHFGLPDGATASVIAYHRGQYLELLNSKLDGISIDEFGIIPKAQRPAWTRLMQSLGVSRAWWMDGDSSVIDLSNVKVKRI
jgi:hypothetical protein